MSNKSSKINALFILHNTELGNGATHSMIDIIVDLKKNKKVDPIVIFCGAENDAIPYLKEQNVKCYNTYIGIWYFKYSKNPIVSLYRRARAILRFYKGLIKINRVYEIVKENNIDIVCSNTSVVSAGYVINKKYKIPHVWYIREFMKEDHNFGFAFGEKRFVRCLDKYTTSIIFISRALVSKYASRINNKSKINIFYNDISSDSIIKHSNNSDSSSLKMAVIGTVQEGKRQEDAVRAVKILKNEGVETELYIVGHQDSSYGQKIKNLVSDLGLEKEVFLEAFTKNIREFRSRMDIGIVPSRCEAFGRVTIEGMLAHMLMVCSNSGGSVELIEDGKTGFLFNVCDPESLAAVIKKVDRDRKLLAEVAENGYNFALGFTKSKTAEEVEKLLVEAVKNGNDYE